ncbi:MAG: class I SAM-dependent methyltransferase [Nocardioides sp.]
MTVDPWVAGEAYEPYIGRWSRLVAPQFVDWLGIPAGRRWVDVGCGTGALAAAVLSRAEPGSVLGVDPSPDFVAWAADHQPDGRASFAVGDAASLPPTCADVVVSGLVVNFIPDPVPAVVAMAAAARVGTVAAYVWDYAGRMELLRHFWDAAAAVDPAAETLHEAARFPDCHPEALAALWADAGLAEVATMALEVTERFGSVDALWAPFLGGQGPAPGYVATLAPERREAVRAVFQDRLPVAPDGTVALTARAFAVRGAA